MAVLAVTEVPRWLEQDLRSDHAGEVGAVNIYRGILTVSRDPRVREFAQRHLETERSHLDYINACLPPARRSLLIPGWIVAAFLLGALPALFGRRAVFATIAAVETFVDRHYQEQIDRLAGMPEFDDLRELLDACRRDECEHRDEAAELAGATGLVGRLWGAVVGNGSAAAVVVARLI